MTNFERFKEQLEEEYTDIHKFGEVMYDWGFENLPFGGEVVESNHEDYDSYGNSVDIKTVVHFKEFDIYIKFESHRQSFNGIIWDTYYEVNKIDKTQTTYE